MRPSCLSRGGGACECARLCAGGQVPASSLTIHSGRRICPSPAPPLHGPLHPPRAIHEGTNSDAQQQELAFRYGIACSFRPGNN